MVIKRDQYECVCERVIDGDTIIITFDCPTCSTIARIRLRLARIDAPEFGEQDKSPAEWSRLVLAELIEGQRVTVVPKLAWPDKYGRTVAEVICKDVNISNKMVELGAARWWP